MNRERKAGHELGDKVMGILANTGVSTVSCEPIEKINFSKSSKVNVETLYRNVQALRERMGLPPYAP